MTYLHIRTYVLCSIILAFYVAILVIRGFFWHCIAHGGVCRLLELSGYGPLVAKGISLWQSIFGCSASMFIEPIHNDTLELHTRARTYTTESVAKPMNNVYKDVL